MSLIANHNRISWFTNRSLLSFFAGSLLCSAALAGPEWIESTLGDAGDRTDTAQPTGGTGELGRISGKLTQALSIDGSSHNFQDAFIINIINPAEFTARTASPGGSADFDSQLWLFTIDGYGLLGNDDTFETEDGKTGCILAGATLRNAATDSTGTNIPGPGLYILAISTTKTVPGNADGPIFSFGCEAGEISGPDGAGGRGKFDRWIDSGDEQPLGDYRIALTGVGMSGLYMDIRPGGCPNPLNLTSPGVLPVAIVGSGGTNIAAIVPTSLRISRADGVGDSVAALANPTIQDTATPSNLDGCGCVALKGDGMNDLNVRFRIQDMVAALQLDRLPGGTTIQLQVTGFYQDDSIMGAIDCVWIVPPSLVDRFEDWHDADESSDAPKE